MNACRTRGESRKQRQGDGLEDITGKSCQRPIRGSRQCSINGEKEWDSRIWRSKTHILSDILARWRWSQFLSWLCYATQGWQEEERCRKVSQERQTSCEQIKGQGQKEEVSKGRVRDKLNNLVLFDKATSDKLWKEVPNYKLITPVVISARPKVCGSLARVALQDLHSKGLMKLVSKHRAQVVYTRNTKGAGKYAWMGPTNCTFWKVKLQEARDNN